MRKRPTPETDAVAAYEGNWDTKALRMTAHSRKLERERDEAREEIRDWKRLHDAAERGVDLTIAEGTISDLLKQRDEARRELKFLWRERDEAREALKHIEEYGTEEINAAIDLRQKLASALVERDEAQKELSSIYRWIERNHVDGFIDSLTYLKNLERVMDCWYDRLDKIERERDEWKNKAYSHATDYTLMEAKCFRLEQQLKEYDKLKS